MGRCGLATVCLFTVLLISLPEAFTLGLYDFSVETIHGRVIPLSVYDGMVSLVVNVASDCGYTDDHYSALVQLQKDLAITHRFTVLAFPCNQFGMQESQENREIFSHMKERFDVNFPMFAKADVRDASATPFWKSLNDASQSPPTWNFWKYLIDHKGELVGAWGPNTSVEDIKDDIMDTLKDADIHLRDEL